MTFLPSVVQAEHRGDFRLRVVFSDGSSLVAWAAIGYILFGGLLTGGSPHWPLLALAVALMALVPRPRGSLWNGIGVAFVVAIGARLVIGALL